MLHELPGDETLAGHQHVAVADAFLQQIEAFAVDQDLLGICPVAAGGNIAHIVGNGFFQVRSFLAVHDTRRCSGRAQGDRSIQRHVFFSAGGLDRSVELAGDTEGRKCGKTCVTAAVIIAQGLEETEHAFLYEVFGISSKYEHGPCAAANESFIAAHERLGSTVIILSGQSDQLVIRQTFVVFFLHLYSCFLIILSGGGSHT